MTQVVKCKRMFLITFCKRNIDNVTIYVSSTNIVVMLNILFMYRGAFVQSLLT